MNDIELCKELMGELEQSALSGQAGAGPLRAEYVLVRVKAGKDAIAALEARIKTLEREVCTCPWPADAMRTRHLLSCRLMEMEHAALAAQRRRSHA